MHKITSPSCLSSEVEVEESTLLGNCRRCPADDDIRKSSGKHTTHCLKNEMCSFFVITSSRSLCGALEARLYSCPTSTSKGRLSWKKKKASKEKEGEERERKPLTQFVFVVKPTVHTRRRPFFRPLHSAVDTGLRDLGTHTHRDSRQPYRV